jgi:predicted kinase
MTTFTIIRGLPGSGKSTLAKQIAGFTNALHFEADMFFEQNGSYDFNIALIGEAHRWCQSNVYEALEAERSVIVSNTFTTMKELEPYITMSNIFGIKAQIITCQGDFGSIHNVPKDTLDKMKRRFQFNLT